METQEVTKKRHIEIVYIVIGLLLGFVGAALITIWPPVIWIYALIAIGIVIDGIILVLKR